MNPPTLAEVRAHEPCGGVWRVVPVRAMPFYVVLKAHRNVVSLNNGATPAEHLQRKENAHCDGATWIPCDVRGERVGT